MKNNLIKLFRATPRELKKLKGTPLMSPLEFLIARLTLFFLTLPMIIFLLAEILFPGFLKFAPGDLLAATIMGTRNFPE